jgi:hypothetical protein
MLQYSKLSRFLNTLVDFPRDKLPLLLPHFLEAKKDN